MKRIVMLFLILFVMIGMAVPAVAMAAPAEAAPSIELLSNDEAAPLPGDSEQPGETVPDTSESTYDPDAEGASFLEDDTASEASSGHAAQGHHTKGTARIHKSGNDGRNVQGAVYSIYRHQEMSVSSDGHGNGPGHGWICDVTTDADGYGYARRLPSGDYYAVEKSVPSPYKLDAEPQYFTITYKKPTVSLAFVNEVDGEAGRVKILKTDDSQKPLSGVVFGLYRAWDEKELAVLTTREGGTAESDPLVPQAYYLLELTGKEGYAMVTERIPFTVDGSGDTVELSIINRRIPAPENGSVHLTKKCAVTGTLLEGAVFGAYRAENSEKVGELTTNASGSASLALPSGSYYLLEQTAPKGYQKLTEPTHFTIVSGETKELTIKNVPVASDTPISTGTVRFIKRAAGSGERLPGAVIGVYRADNDKKVAELTTNARGVAEYDLTAGRYYWKELRAPEGFSLLEGRYSFTVTADKTGEITVENKAVPTDTGTLRIIKKAAGTGARIADSVFGVYTVSGNRKTAEIITGDDGEVEIQLAPGSYYLRELSVPSPFVPETAKIPFRIKAAGAAVKIEVSNTKGLGTVRLEKRDTDGNAVSGAVFTLYRSGGTRIADLTSGQDGTAFYELPMGTGYYLAEKTAAAGYRLDTSRHGFDIRHGETTTVKVVNQPIAGTVEVYFRHIADSRELAGMKSLTDRVGTDYIKWMREKKYENMPINGYALIRTDYPASLALTDGKLTVTLWYTSAATDNAGGIQIPKTGGSFPAMTFALSALCWTLASFCAVMLVKERRQPTAAIALCGMFRKKNPRR